MTDSRAYGLDERRGFGRYLTAFRDRWYLIVALVVIAVGATALYSLTAAKRYKAQADLVVTPIAADDPTFLGITTPLRNLSQSEPVITAARIAEAPAVTGRVQKRLGLDRSPNVQVKPLAQSNIVTVVATASSGAQAARIANAYAESVVALRRADFQSELERAIARLESRLAKLDAAAARPSSKAVADEMRARLAQLESHLGEADPTLSILNRATPPESSSWPRPKLSIAVALLASLLVGMGIALALDIANPLVKDRDELLFEHRLPVLGELPRVGQRAVRRFLARRERLPPELAEGYRMVSGTLEHSAADHGFPRTILVTSTTTGEGKTITAMSLAEAIVQSGLHVILVDGDIRKPMISAVYGPPAKKRSLPAVLRGVTLVGDALKTVGRSRLQLLLSIPDPNAVDLLRKGRVAEVVGELARRADVVVIDSSPVGEVADALAFADAVDAVIVCVRLGRTRRDKLSELRQRLARVGVAPSGCIVIGRKRSRSSSYYYARTRQAPTAARRRPRQAPPAGVAAGPSEMRRIARRLAGRGGST